MSYHHLLKRALEIDLEEIKHLALACRTAPPGVRHILLDTIAAETREACIWNALLVCHVDGMMPPCPDPGDYYKPPCPDPGDCYKPPYGGYYPYQQPGSPGKKEK